MIEFESFPKIARLSREVIITEKIDGTNAQIYIPNEDEKANSFRKVWAGSRNRWLEPGSDNFGFAAWVDIHWEDLLKLGPGRHFGEWWGQGIQRGYGLKEKRFSLFNTGRWNAENKPECCHVVPVLYKGLFDDEHVSQSLMVLKEFGSMAAPGFKNPEGIVLYHTHANVLFKKTFEKDSTGKDA